MTTVQQQTTATFTRLKDGTWGARVQGPVKAGDVIQVTKKSGRTKSFQVAAVLWTSPDGLVRLVSLVDPQPVGAAGYRNWAPRRGYSRRPGYRMRPAPTPVQPTPAISPVPVVAPQPVPVPIHQTYQVPAFPPDAVILNLSDWPDFPVVKLSPFAGPDGRTVYWWGSVQGRFTVVMNDR